MSLVAACASSPRRVRRPRPAEAPPTLAGRAVYPGPLPAARLVAYWSDARAQLADAVSDARDVDGVRAWAQRRLEALRALGVGAGDIHARGDAVDELFAAIVYATVTDDLIAQLASLDPPRRPADLALRPEHLVVSSRDAWQRCVVLVADAPAEMRAWAAPCASRVEALAPVVAQIEARAEAQRAAQAAAAPARPTPVVIPASCEDSPQRAALVDPEAPPPINARPREVLLRYDADDSGDGRFDGPDRDRLVAAVRAWMVRTSRARLVPIADVRAAEALVRARRWRPAGPVCGQAPPLPAVLSARHPNLVIATVSTWCGEVVDDADGRIASHPSCTLTVTSHRAGTDDQRGVPATRGVRLDGPRGDVARWLAAVPRLAENGGGLGLLGGLMAGDGGLYPYYRLAAFDDDDPWLRVGPTLYGNGNRDAVRDAMQACAPHARGVGSYRLTWTISPTGATLTPTVTPERADDTATAQCLTERLGAVAWPCPRGARPVPVEATLCVGWR